MLSSQTKGHGFLVVFLVGILRWVNMTWTWEEPARLSNVCFLVEPSPTFPSQDLIFARPLASKCAITDCLDVFGIHIAEFGISSQVSSTYINNVCTYRRAMPVLVPRQAKTSPLAMHPALF